MLVILMKVCENCPECLLTRYAGTPLISSVCGSSGLVTCLWAEKKIGLNNKTKWRIYSVVGNSKWYNTWLTSLRTSKGPMKWRLKMEAWAWGLEWNLGPSAQDIAVDEHRGVCLLGSSVGIWLFTYEHEQFPRFAHFSSSICWFLAFRSLCVRWTVQYYVQYNVPVQYNVFLDDMHVLTCQVTSSARQFVAH